ncbi:MAG: (Fe-S)-binding protein [Lachnospiraceae bacterium]
MALKGLDIFKLSPKKNCKECGCPTCAMAFSMKVALEVQLISLLVRISHRKHWLNFQQLPSRQ